MSRLKWYKCMTVLLLVFILPVMAHAQSSVNTDASGLALEGYDPVAYFAQGEAVRGLESISAVHEGARYLFASENHRELFLEAPADYLPAYGGYCAWAVGQGYIADIDPRAWTISGSRLFLNYSRSVHRRFNRNLDANITAADANWPGLRP